MPAIRKKTSNRGTTNKRARIQGKIRESRKKQKRDAKKNVQWKSKHKKDPGIPNNFPYKDQILAEVAEQRRQATEEKQRRKDEKKVAKAGPTAEDGSDAEGGSEDEGDPAVFDGVGSVTGKATMQAKGKGKGVVEDVEMEPQEGVPILINQDLPNLQSVLDQADVILQVLDARDPLAFRSSHLEELTAAKLRRQMLFVLNKIDTIPRESVSSWLAYLRTQHPTLPFCASSAFLPTATEPAIKSKGKEPASTYDATGAGAVLTYLSECAQRKDKDEPLAVAVIGLTNAGKSSFINSLLGKAVLPIYSLSSSSLTPTTTSLPQEVTLEVSGRQIRLIDTPGLSWQFSSDESSEEHEALRARDILLRNKGRIDRLKDPTSALADIVSRADTEDLMLFYSLPAFSKGDTNAFLSGIARSNGMVKKAGTLDLTGAARIVLRDWSTGKFPRFTPAPAVPEATFLTQPTSLGELYSKDEEVLSKLRTRKDMRRSTGLIKLVAGHIESRKADVETGWVGSDDHGDDTDEEQPEDTSDGDERAGSDGDVAIDDSEELDDDESEEDDEPAPAPTGKRKRLDKPTGSPARPNKKVSFAAGPKESKRARAAGSTKKPISTASKPRPMSSRLKTSRAANVNASKTSQKTTSSKGGEEAYDFGKFF